MAPDAPTPRRITVKRFRRYAFIYIRPFRRIWIVTLGWALPPTEWAIGVGTHTDIDSGQVGWAQLGPLHVEVDRA